MGIQDARSTAHVSRIVGKGALTAAAALAVVGGSASVASAAELPSAPNADGALASTGHAHDATDGKAKQMADEVIDVKHQVSDLDGSVDPTLISMAGPEHKASVDKVIDGKHKVEDLSGSLDPTMLDVAHQMDSGAPRVAKGNDVHVSRPDARQGAAQVRQAPGHVENGMKQINTGKLSGASAPGMLSFL